MSRLSKSGGHAATQTTRFTPLANRSRAVFYAPEDFTDAQAIAAIERITRGNFRLLERLFPQIACVLRINQLETITDDVVEAAASILVIGD